MGYLNRPIITDAQLKDGIPPGKAILWVRNKERTLTPYYAFESESDALHAMPEALVEIEEMRVTVVVNYKSPDGGTLYVYTLDRRELQRRNAGEPNVFDKAFSALGESVNKLRDKMDNLFKDKP
jgi:hypothetical protein